MKPHDKDKLIERRRNLATHIISHASLEEIERHEMVLIQFAGVLAPPAHPGNIIKLKLNDSGMSINVAAAAMEIASSHLSRVTNLQGGLSAFLAIKLEKLIGISADNLLAKQREYELFYARQSVTTKLIRLTDLKMKFEGLLNLDGLTLHPGQLLGPVIENVGLSLSAVSTALDISRQQLQKVIKAKNGVSPEMAVRLEYVVGGRAEDWLSAQNKYDLSCIGYMPHTPYKIAKPLKMKSLRPS